LLGSDAASVGFSNTSDEVICAPSLERVFEQNRKYRLVGRWWTVVLHRFVEVSVGIIVALAIVALWPEHQRLSPNSSAE